MLLLPYRSKHFSKKMESSSSIHLKWNSWKRHRFATISNCKTYAFQTLSPIAWTASDGRSTSTQHIFRLIYFRLSILIENRNQRNRPRREWKKSRVKKRTNSLCRKFSDKSKIIAFASEAEKKRDCSSMHVAHFAQWTMNLMKPKHYLFPSIIFCCFSIFISRATNGKWRKSIASKWKRNVVKMKTRNSFRCIWNWINLIFFISFLSLLVFAECFLACCTRLQMGQRWSASFSQSLDIIFEITPQLFCSGRLSILFQWNP